MSNEPIQITQAAARQIESLLGKAPQGTKGLRLTIKTTGCSGNSYKMEYIGAEESTEKDDRFLQHGVMLYVPKIYSWMLFGTIVDYIVDELGNARFDFRNPNESGRCGCGESFHVSVDELKAPEKV